MKSREEHLTWQNSARCSKAIDAAARPGVPALNDEGLK